jgi:hypothetical protein
LTVTSLLATSKTDWQTVDLRTDWQRLQPAWDELVARHPKGSVFHTSAMIAVLQAAKGIRPLPLAAAADNGEILALLVAARVQTLADVLGEVSSRSVWYAEPLCSGTPRGIEALCGLIADHDRLMRGRVLFAEVRPLNAARPGRVALEQYGHEHLDYLDYVIDTTLSRDVLWKNMRHSAYTNIRKCERLGLKIRHVDEPASIDVLYGVLKLTFARANVPLADRSRFDAALKILQPLGMLELAAIYDGETPLAAAAMLLWNLQVFSWYCGSERAYQLGRMVIS